MPRLLYVAPFAIPSRCAHGVQVMRMCQAFADCGSRVRLLVPQHDRDGQHPGDLFAYYGVRACFEVQTVAGDWSQLDRLRFARRAARQAKAFGADVVFGRCLKSVCAAAWAGIPAAFEAHVPARHSGRATPWLFEWLSRHRQFRRLVVISQALRREFEASYPAARGKVMVAHDGADPVDPAAPRAELAATGPGRLRAGYVGHLYPGKGIEIVVALARRCRWADFHVVGGTEADLARWRSRTPDQPNLFWHGFVPPSAATRLRLGCDVLLAPYQSHAGNGHAGIAPWMSPLKIFEYMASARPIICSDLPVLREVLAHGRTAVMVAPHEVEAWVAALRHLADDEGLRASIGRAARDEFSGRYTWRARAGRILEQVQ